MNIDPLELHEDFVRRLALEILLDGDAAEDVVQQTRVAASELEKNPERSFRGWLATVSRNFARSRLRAEGRRYRRERAAASAEGVPSTEEIVVREEARRQVVERVLALPEHYRSVVILRYYEDLPPREIARRLDSPVETVKSRLKRAHALLRRELDEDHGPHCVATLALLAGWDPAQAAVRGGLDLTLRGVLFMKRKVIAAALVVLLLTTGALFFWGQEPMDPAEQTSTAATSQSDGSTSDQGMGAVSKGGPDSAAPPVAESKVDNSKQASPVGTTEIEEGASLQVKLVGGSELRATLELFVVTDPEILASSPPLSRVFEPQTDGTLGVVDSFRSLLRRVAEATNVGSSHRFSGLEAGTYLVRAIAAAHAARISPLIELGENEAETAALDLAAGVTLTILAPGHEELRVSLSSVALTPSLLLEPTGLEAAELTDSLLEAIAPIPPRPTTNGLVFEHLTPGSWTVIASARERATEEFRVNIQTNHTLDIELDREGVLEVTVTDTTGAPIVDATIHARAEARSIETTLPGLHTITTGADGTVEIRGLTAGRYEVVAEAPGLVGPDTIITTVAAGSTATIDFTMTAALALHGKVQDAAGTPVHGARVTAKIDSKSATVTSDEEGYFEFTTLPLGAGRLTVQHPHFSALRQEFGADDEHVTLTLEHGDRVQGLVVDASGEPVFGARIKVGDGFFKVWRATTGSDGSFSLAGLKGKSLYLKIEADGFLTSKETLASRGDVGAVTLKNSIAIRGQVVGPDGSPIARARVLAQGFSREEKELPFRGDFVVATNTDADGGYVLHPKAESDHWSVVALADGFLRSEEAIVDGEVDDLRLGLRRGGRLVGTVADESGVAIANAQVTLRSKKRLRRRFDPDRPPISAKVRTDGSGSFEIAGLPPGEHCVRVTKAGHAPTLSAWSVVVDGGEAETSVALGSPLQIAGRVVDSDGKPIAGVQVRAKGKVTPSVSARTDDEGRFVLRDVAAEELAIHAWKRGFQAWETDAHGPTGGNLEITLSLLKKR